MRRSTILGLVLAVFAVGVIEARAQSPYVPRPRRTYMPYQPARPTLSPWFNLYNTNRGPLPNYYNYVVPRQQLERTLHEQENAIRLQNAEYQRLQSDVSRFERAAPVRPTGSSSDFFNHAGRFQNQRTFFGTR